MESGSYKAIDGTELKLDIFLPEQVNGTTIVFFFGGGWGQGTTEQFHPQCLYLNNYGRSENKPFEKTMKDTVNFLSGLDLINTWENIDLHN